MHLFKTDTSYTGQYNLRYFDSFGTLGDRGSFFCFHGGEAGGLASNRLKRTKTHFKRAIRNVNKNPIKADYTAPTDLYFLRAVCSDKTLALDKHLRMEGLP